MTDKNDISVPSQGSMVRDLLVRIRLIWFLMKDKRINPFLKFIPILGVLYLVMPIDILPAAVFSLLGGLDDAGVIWLTSYVFVQLCPPEIVMQHVRSLTAGPTSSQADDVVDAESVEIKDIEK